MPQNMGRYYYTCDTKYYEWCSVGSKPTNWNLVVIIIVAMSISKQNETRFTHVTKCFETFQYTKISWRKARVHYKL